MENLPQEDNSLIRTEGGLQRKDGLLHLYTGNGKGKTSAAIGLALRMAGHGQRVLFTQFLKSTPSGELKAFERFGDLVESRRPAMRHKAFLWHQTEAQRIETAEDLVSGWREMAPLLMDASFRLFVFDELLDVISMGMLTQEEVQTGLAGRHPRAEVVLTGREASPEMIHLADYVTEMTLRKHPYERGIQARAGVEW